MQTSPQPQPAGKVTLNSGVSVPSGTQTFGTAFGSVSPTPTVVPTATPSATLTATPSGVLQPLTPTFKPTPTATPTGTTGTISGNISYHGQTPVNSRIVIFVKLTSATNAQVAVDNLTPVDGALWQWTGAVTGTSYTVYAVLKQKQSDGTDKDIAASSTITITAPSGFIVLTVNSYYTLTKPTGTSNVSCTTYNGGPNQNTWNVTVNFPSYSGAQSYWLEVGSADGGSDVVNTYGNVLSAAAIFKNNTTYYGRYAYAAVASVDTGSGQYSAFSDTTRLTCGK